MFKQKRVHWFVLSMPGVVLGAGLCGKQESSHCCPYRWVYRLVGETDTKDPAWARTGSSRKGSLRELTQIRSALWFWLIRLMLRVRLEVGGDLVRYWYGRKGTPCSRDSVQRPWGKRTWCGSKGRPCSKPGSRGEWVVMLKVQCRATHHHGFQTLLSGQWKFIRGAFIIKTLKFCNYCAMMYC